MKATGKFTVKHGLYGTKVYSLWIHIKQRCYDKNIKDYKHYGARGIKMSDEWVNNPVAFCEWAKEHGYEESLTIDRIDPNGDYTPNNCRFIDNTSQQRNKRNNRRVSFMGETYCISEWAELLGINRITLRSRLDCGWTVEKALLEQVQEHRQGLRP